MGLQLKLYGVFTGNVYIYFIYIFVQKIATIKSYTTNAPHWILYAFLAMPWVSIGLRWTGH